MAEKRIKQDKNTLIGSTQLELLEKLCNASGVTGDEGAVRKTVKSEINNSVDEMKIDKIPGIAILGSEDLGLRFYGIPTGYEFATFLDTLLKASSGLSGLPEALKKKLERVDKPVHIQVFVTPTCPYCPVAALTALKLAMENDHITADVVEITEFPHLSQKYGVMGVPKVILNEVHSFEGALSEDLFVEHVLNIGLDNSERA